MLTLSPVLEALPSLDLAVGAVPTRKAARLAELALTLLSLSLSLSPSSSSSSLLLLLSPSDPLPAAVSSMSPALTAASSAV